MFIKHYLEKIFKLIYLPLCIVTSVLAPGLLCVLASTSARLFPLSMINSIVKKSYNNDFQRIKFFLNTMTVVI
jgi:hypothetical protein